MIKHLWSNSTYKKDAAYIHSLKNCELLKNLKQAQLNYLLKNLHKRTYEKNENIFQQDNTGNATYIILSGNVNIHYKAEKTASILNNTDISILSPGAFFGETNLYQDDAIRRVSATSTQKSILLSLFVADLRNIAKVYPKIATQLLLNLGEILSTRIEQITQSNL